MTKDNYFDMIRDRDVFISCLLYGLTSLLQGTQDALIPLWLLNPISQGGFLWKQSEIGWLYTGLGPVQVIFAPVIFPALSKVITYKTNYISSGILYGISLALHPLASLTNQSAEWVCFLLLYHSLVPMVLDSLYRHVCDLHSSMQLYISLFFFLSIPCVSFIRSHPSWFWSQTVPIWISEEKSMAWDKCLLPSVVQLYSLPLRKPHGE